MWRVLAAVALCTSALVSLCYWYEHRVGARYGNGLGAISAAMRDNNGLAAVALVETTDQAILTRRTGNPVLADAVFWFGADLSRYLMMRGVPPDAHDLGGVTPLMIAASLSSPEKVGILLKNRANPNAQVGDGMTPLMSVGSNGSNDSAIVASMLLSADADACIRDHHGRSGLDHPSRLLCTT